MVATGGVILTLPARSVGVTMNWSSMVAVLIVYLVGWSINISKELELGPYSRKRYDNLTISTNQKPTIHRDFYKRMRAQ